MLDLYHPPIDLLTTCGFRRSTAPGEWCHRSGIHIHYFELGHAVEVYNGAEETHTRTALASRSDEAFKAEIAALAAARPWQG